VSSYVFFMRRKRRKSPEVYDAPGIVINGDNSVKICTPFGDFTIFENGWEFEKGGGDCHGKQVELKVKEEEDYIAIKYADGKIYAMKLDYWPEVAVADSELELPDWAKF